MDTVLFFCEHAATRSDSKLTVEGIYNELYAPDFPAKQDRILLAGIIEWDRDIHGSQNFKINLLDPDKIPIFTIEGSTEIDERPENRAPAKTHLIFPLENLVFVAPGQYQIQLELLDTLIAGPCLHLMRSNTTSDKS